MRKPVLIFCLFITSLSVYSQLSVHTLLGKNADKYRVGSGMFLTWEFPVNAEGNQNITLDLIDLVVFPLKDEYSYFASPNGAAYFSMKLGYKHIFSETKTGFYLKSALGYCKVMNMVAFEEVDDKKGMAAAIEGGYSLEVGQRGNYFNFGIKFETDRAGPEHTLNSAGFRVAYSFGMFGGKED
jgi:hypothetical protein